MSRSLIVLPDDSARPILDAIDGAEKSIRVKMFLFSDPDLLEADHCRSPARGQGASHAESRAAQTAKEENQESRQLLRKSGIDVIDSNPEFDVTHEKSMVVDDEDGIREIAELGHQESDRDSRLRGCHHPRSGGGRDRWNASRPTGTAKPFDGRPNSHLIWCNANGRDRIARFIDEAKHSLWLQNERYQDPSLSSAWSAPIAGE